MSPPPGGPARLLLPKHLPGENPPWRAARTRSKPRELIKKILAAGAGPAQVSIGRNEPEEEKTPPPAEAPPRPSGAAAVFGRPPAAGACSQSLPASAASPADPAHGKGRLGPRRPHSYPDFTHAGPACSVNSTHLAHHTPTCTQPVPPPSPTLSLHQEGLPASPQLPRALPQVQVLCPTPPLQGSCPGALRSFSAGVHMLKTKGRSTF